MTSFDDNDESELVKALATRHAVLLLGQSHSPTSALLSDVAAALRVDRRASFRDQLVDVTGPADMANVMRALSLHSPSPDLVDIAKLPWSFVLTSAVDTIVVEAFRRASGTARRLRLLNPRQAVGPLARRSTDALTIVRLFGSIDEQDERYLPPFTRLALQRRQRFEVAAVLQELPLFVGPYGCLVVTGIDSTDWLDLSDLALVCEQMPPRSVHWFGEIPDQIATDIGDALVTHEGTLEGLLQRYADTPEGRALSEASDEATNPSSRQLTITSGGASKNLYFTPEEWRNISQVGILLDDSINSAPDYFSPEQEREAVRAFLRHSQYVPDWQGISRGYLFERDLFSEARENIEQMVRRLGSVHELSPDDLTGSATPTSSRHPVLLTGPPACGKSRLLHWLAYRLHVRGHAVLYLITAGRLQFEPVERVCRIIESKGAEAVLVFADGLDQKTYNQLNEYLASSGRNALVIGTQSGLRPPQAIEDDPRGQSDFFEARDIVVAPNLTMTERSRFRQYLQERGFADVTLSPLLIGERYFLLLLYRLLPDARGSIHVSLAGEYERLLNAMDRLQDEDDTPADDSWVTQLTVVRQMLFPDAPTESQQEKSALTHLEEGERAVNLSLFCAQIGKPLPLDLLFRAEGYQFLRRYRDFADALDSSALLQEVEVDNAGTVVLDADHPIVAQLTLSSVIPRRSDQVGLLQPLVDAITWDENAFPGERPDQDYCVEVLQAIGPRGIADSSFQGYESLQAISDLLVRIHSEYGVRLPRLLLLEANTLRLLADRSAADSNRAMRRCEEALAALDMAEEILWARRATASRNSELANVLNTRAAVYGFIVNNLLREYRMLGDPNRQAIRDRIFRDLAEVDRLAALSRGLGSPTFYPLDVTFWSYRDTFEQLPDLNDAERARLLERMEEVLDSASEEPIEANQVGRFRRRTVNLAQLEGNVVLSEELARHMRDEGDFSGECLLVRREVFEPGTRRVLSRESAIAGLDRLESFGTAAYGSAEALELMNRLWMAAFLPDTNIGGPDPVMAACSDEDWYRWRRILDARLNLTGSGQNLFLGFCLSWTLFQLDEPRLAQQETRAMEPLTVGSRRRVGCLVVLTDSLGNAKRFSGTMRRREGDAIVVYLPTLRTEIRLSPVLMSRLPVLPTVGDQVEMEIGLNYRGPLPWRLLP